jgi:hypothetical protein
LTFLAKKAYGDVCERFMIEVEFWMKPWKKLPHALSELKKADPL